MISSLSWVPRGAAKLKPDFVEIDENDEDAIQAMKRFNKMEQVRSWSPCMADMQQAT